MLSRIIADVILLNVLLAPNDLSDGVWEHFDTEAPVSAPDGWLITETDETTAHVYARQTVTLPTVQRTMTAAVRLKSAGFKHRFELALVRGSGGSYRSVFINLDAEVAVTAQQGSDMDLLAIEARVRNGFLEVRVTGVADASDIWRFQLNGVEEDTVDVESYEGVVDQGAVVDQPVLSAGAHTLADIYGA